MLKKKLHPAAQWAREHTFTNTDVDCTITVVLKILDGKCKMLDGEKRAIMEIYDVIGGGPSRIFNDQVFRNIELARTEPTPTVMEDIHALRIYAESEIPKPTMKSYKAMLREGLFG